MAVRWGGAHWTATRLSDDLVDKLFGIVECDATCSAELTGIIITFG